MSYRERYGDEDERRYQEWLRGAGRGYERRGDEADYRGRGPQSRGRYGENYGINLGWRWRERDPQHWQQARRELERERRFDFQDEDWYDERALEPMWRGERLQHWDQPGFPPRGAFGGYQRFDQPMRRPSGPHAGKGPKSYQRSDERIRDEVNDRLTEHGDIDPSDINVAVSGGIVVLQGEVEDRRAKRLAEDIAEEVSGVKDVRNELHVRGHAIWQQPPQGDLQHSGQA